MKGNFTFILAFILLTALNVHAQNVTLSVKDMPLEKVMAMVSDQTGLSFNLPWKYLGAAKPVTVSSDNEPADAVMYKILICQPFHHTIKDKVISIIPDSTLVNQMDKNNLIIFNKKIYGFVSDTTGSPLIGVTITSKKAGKKIAISNEYGIFTLENAPIDDTLILSCLNYKTTEIAYRNYQLPVVHLPSSPSELPEAVVSGVKPTTKANDTTVSKPPLPVSRKFIPGDIETLKGEKIEHQPVSNLLHALIGRFPGLIVTPVSGVSGAYVKIAFRGQNSLSGIYPPLFIVDGVTFSSLPLVLGESAAGASSQFSLLNTDNIEEIKILKDAEATAIYGSRGANGVILITSKKGKPGPLTFDFKISSGMSKVEKRMDLMNLEGYMQMRTEGFKNDHASPGMFDYDSNGKWGAIKAIDWQKTLIGKPAPFTDVTGICSTGDTRNLLLISIGYRNENTVYPGQFGSTTQNISLNYQYQSTDGKFSLSLQEQYNHNKNKQPRVDPTTLIRSAPGTPPLYKDGKLNYAGGTFNNPEGYLQQKSELSTNNLISGLTVNYKLFPTLFLKANIGYTLFTSTESSRIPGGSVIYSSLPDPAQRMSARGNNTIKMLSAEPQVSYKRSFKDNNVDVMTGAVIQQDFQKGEVVTGWGFSDDSMLHNPYLANNFSRKPAFSEYKYNSLYTRAGYNYKDKYLLNLTGSLNRSSRFAPGKNLGIFWAIGGGMAFSDAPYIKKNWKSLKSGKILASIGRTGNDQLSDYQYLSFYDLAPGYFDTTGLTQLALGNPGISWEIIKKADLTFILEFHNSMLIKISVFRNRTINQYISHNLPASTGFPNATENLPAIIQNTGLELEAQRMLIRYKKFTWHAALSVTFPRNKLVYCPNISETIYAFRYAEGYSLNIRYAYHYLGIDSKTGLYQFEDTNKDGSVNQKDTKPYFVGKWLYGGSEHILSYQGWTLNFFLQFVLQKGINPQNIVAPGQFSGLGPNQENKYLNRWQASGDQAEYQKFFVKDQQASSLNNQYNQSDAQFTDASFIRLKNVDLSYALPETWSKKCRLKSSGIFIQGQNLLTFTKYKGLDAETQENGSGLFLPPLRTVSLGLRITF